MPLNDNHMHRPPPICVNFTTPPLVPASTSPARSRRLSLTSGSLAHPSSLKPLHRAPRPSPPRRPSPSKQSRRAPPRCRLGLTVAASTQPRSCHHYKKMTPK
ncbi:hypothetical protein PIB30_068171, partial [Stylosanthes scabra]|nr:hypothetical protein [Stylosanthes scabra]